MRPENDYLFQQRVVSLGGGTGQFAFLRGIVDLNNPFFNTAITGSWDSGSKSGELRDRLGILPMGDYLQCIYGLMEDKEQLRAAIGILRDRSEKRPLIHEIAAQAERHYHGVEGGIEGLLKLFQIRGKVFLATTDDVDLHAETKNGVHYNREHELDKLELIPSFHVDDEIFRIWLEPEARANPKVLEKINEADKIVFTPGSPFGSTFPLLLVGNIPETIFNARGSLILVSNLMTTIGQDHHLSTVSKWLKNFQYYLGDDQYIKKNGRSRIDYLVVNRNGIDQEIINFYKGKGQHLVESDEQDKDECRDLAPGIKIVEEPIVEYIRPQHLLRHNPEALAKTILSL